MQSIFSCIQFWSKSLLAYCCYWIATMWLQFLTSTVRTLASICFFFRTAAHLNDICCPQWCKIVGGGVMSSIFMYSLFCKTFSSGCTYLPKSNNRTHLSGWCYIQRPAAITHRNKIHSLSYSNMMPACDITVVPWLYAYCMYAHAPVFTFWGHPLYVLKV